MILTRAGIGNFTGIKWSSNRQGTYDPYLLWAEATGFAGFGGNPADGWLPLVLQVRSDEAMHTLQKAYNCGDGINGYASLLHTSTKWAR
jgi:hypothetical protein